MADEPTNTASKTRDSPDDDSGAALVFHNDGTARVGTQIGVILGGDIHIYLAETVVAASALTVFCKAFLETLGKRAGDGFVDLVRTHVQGKGKPDEYRIGIADRSAATIAITADTPDEARLALLDLDITDDELRGKLLRWDDDALAWRPAGES